MRSRCFGNSIPCTIKGLPESAPIQPLKTNSFCLVMGYNLPGSDKLVAQTQGYQHPQHWLCPGFARIASSNKRGPSRDLLAEGKKRAIVDIAQPVAQDGKGCANPLLYERLFVSDSCQEVKYNPKAGTLFSQQRISPNKEFLRGEKGRIQEAEKIVNNIVVKEEK